MAKLNIELKNTQESLKKQQVAQRKLTAEELLKIVQSSGEDLMGSGSALVNLEDLHFVLNKITVNSMAQLNRLEQVNQELQVNSVKYLEQIQNMQKQEEGNKKNSAEQG